MSSSKLQKKRIASIMKYAKKKLRLDPNQITEITNANVRLIIRKLLQNDIIFKKLVSGHSRSCIRKHTDTKRRRRQCGFGRRSGTTNDRIEQKDVWGQRLKILKRLLKKDGDDRKIDKRLYHCLYLKVKANVFKNKRLIMEYIHKKKIEKASMKSLHNQNEAKKLKVKEARKRRKQRMVVKKQEMIQNLIKEDREAAAKK